MKDVKPIFSQAMAHSEVMQSSQIPLPDTPSDQIRSVAEAQTGRLLTQG